MHQAIRKADEESGKRITFNEKLYKERLYIAAFLINAGSSLDAKDDNGKTPSDITEKTDLKNEIISEFHKEFYAPSFAEDRIIDAFSKNQFDDFVRLYSISIKAFDRFLVNLQYKSALIEHFKKQFSLIIPEEIRKKIPDPLQEYFIIKEEAFETGGNEDEDEAKEKLKKLIRDLISKHKISAVGKFEGIVQQNLVSHPNTSLSLLLKPLAEQLVNLS